MIGLAQAKPKNILSERVECLGVFPIEAVPAIVKVQPANLSPGLGTWRDGLGKHGQVCQRATKCLRPLPAARLLSEPSPHLLPM